MNSTYKEKWGDIVKEAPEYDAIIHGANCFNLFGEGIAGEIKKVYPEAYEADKNSPMNSDEKLGEYSAVKIKKDNVIIINLYLYYS